MADFIIRFFLCNIIISGIILILFMTKRLFRKYLSGHMQYYLWYVLLFIMFLPFFPITLTRLPQALTWILNRQSGSFSKSINAFGEAALASTTNSKIWMNDLTLSVNSKTPSAIGVLLLGIWILGVVVMNIMVIQSITQLKALQASALPLQNQEIQSLYKRCKQEINIHKNIPIYSTAFLKSPVIVGLLKPCIYLPIHLIYEFRESEMRYMLLHELQHYKNKDAIAGNLMNLLGILYWFNPFVWFALREMRNDREVACDSGVLKLLDADSYKEYGHTLINFAQKISLTPFPFASGLGGSMKQMLKRISNIASYEKPNLVKRIRGMLIFILIASILLGFAPILTTNAAQSSYYQWKASAHNIADVDLSAHFKDYKGSFVLYDLENDRYLIHNRTQALKRVSPNSTYKIYDALFGLEEAVITPSDSFMAWDGNLYPFDAWNTDQTLQSAMQSSVNWYFQSLDGQLGADRISRYIQGIGYGNENISGNFPAYWMESTLQISPVEQVELLTKLYVNSFHFAPDHIKAVKDSILLSTSETGSFYGKTGTGRVDGQDVNGWFVGYVEILNHTYLFATNISAEQYATGSNAAQITLSILNEMNIWK